MSNINRELSKYPKTCIEKYHEGQMFKLCAFAYTKIQEFVISYENENEEIKLKNYNIKKNDY